MLANGWLLLFHIAFLIPLAPSLSLFWPYSVTCSPLSWHCPFIILNLVLKSSSISVGQLLLLEQKLTKSWVPLRVLSGLPTFFLCRSFSMLSSIWVCAYLIVPNMLAVWQRWPNFSQKDQIVGTVSFIWSSGLRCSYSVWLQCKCNSTQFKNEQTWLYFQKNLILSNCWVATLCPGPGVC